MNNFDCTIVRNIASFDRSDNTKIEVNLIDYKGHGIRIDIRRWRKNPHVMLKGISLLPCEFKELMEAMEHEKI